MVHHRFEQQERFVRQVAEWRKRVQSGADYQDEMDRSWIKLSALLGDFNRSSGKDFVQEVMDFVEAGNRAELHVFKGGWDAKISVNSGGVFTVTAQGHWPDAFPDDATITKASSNCEHNDARRLIGLCSDDLHCEFTPTICNDASKTGTRWLRVVAAVNDLIGVFSWLGLVKNLFNPAGPRRLVIHDAGTDCLCARGFVVHGPEVFPEEPCFTTEKGWCQYRETWFDSSRTQLPVPHALVIDEVEGFADLSLLFQALAHGLVWVWLAASARVTTKGRVYVTFEAARQVERDLTQPPPPQGYRDADALWTWAVCTTEGTRREAIQQAVSLVVHHSRDLESAAGRILRAAKYLYLMAQEDAIADALATRRDARLAAMSAARASAEGIRTASRSVVDRTVTQLAAAVGILFANKGDLIETTLAGWLLGAVLVLVIVTAVVAFGFELPAARRILEAFRKDLDGYADTLIDDDIDSIKGMQGLKAVERQLRVARWVTGAVLLIAFLAVGLLFLLTTGEPKWA